MPLKRTLDNYESTLLKFLLGQTGQPQNVKTALQRLCGLLEKGVFFPDRPAFRQPVLSLLYHKDLLVRRWATKAIALLGMGTTTSPNIVLDALKRESDFENIAWFIAAIGQLYSETNVKKICDDAGIDYLKEYELAARLFLNARFKALGPKFIDIEKDGNLALRWLALLEGYKKAPENVAHHTYSNSEMVRQLNTHPDPTVSEYSIWALWQNPATGYDHLMIKCPDYVQKPAGVRRWIYRLFTKTTDVILSELDAFQQFSSDPSEKAREGLEQIRFNVGHSLLP